MENTVTSYLKLSGFLELNGWVVLILDQEFWKSSSCVSWNVEVAVSNLCWRFFYASVKYKSLDFEFLKCFYKTILYVFRLFFSPMIFLWFYSTCKLICCLYTIHIWIVKCLTYDFYKYGFNLVHRKLSDFIVNDLVSCYAICFMYFYCCSSFESIYLCLYIYYVSQRNSLNWNLAAKIWTESMHILTYKIQPSAENVH